MPALGEASETCTNLPADAKITAFERWRQAGIPAMQVVFAGATHFWWSSQTSEAQHDLAHANTRAWFDRWLKADSAATTRLLGATAPRSPPRATVDVLSARFPSAAAFDERACGDLRVGC